VEKNYNMNRFNVWYIPYDKLLSDDPASYTEWMVVQADNKGEAKNYARQDGLIVRLEPL
tara:strand:+ start:464 stop:640 length:177 start_codon:yes stop_codon:yes gene_type:complete